MSFEAAAAWPRHFESSDRLPPPPEIRVDDDDAAPAAAAKLPSSPPPANDASWTGDERRRSMPASHGGRFVDEPYVFSLSQALALAGRRRSEPSVDAGAGAGGGVKRDSSGGSGGGSPGRHVFVDQLASSGVHATEAGEHRRGSVGSKTTATPTTTTTTTLASLDESSRLQLVAGDASCFSREDSDDEQLGAGGARFLSLPQSAADCLAVPARRHSVALIQPTSSRILDVIAEETVATDSKSLAASRRYSLSCQLNS